MAPAVVMVRCKFSQSYTQMLTINNQTQQEFVFEMVAEDVVVRDGNRIFVPAGETPGGIAATAVFSQKQVVVNPGNRPRSESPSLCRPETPLRAAVALFRGLNKVSSRGPVMMTASLGALFTFTVSENFQIEGSPVAVSAQSATANLGISQVLTNTGSEPVIAGGIAAVLNETGTLVGKASFEEQRLLPGERLPFRAEYPAELKTGRYRVFASFQYEEKVITNSSGFYGAMKRWVFILVLVVYPATARTQSITVDYRQTISVPLPGALAAFSLDDFYAEAKAQDETLTIFGKNPGSAHIVAVVRDGTKTFEVQVLPAPPSYPPGFVQPLSASAASESGSYESRYTSGPSQSENIVDFMRREGDRSVRFHLDGTFLSTPVRGPKHVRP